MDKHTPHSAATYIDDLATDRDEHNCRNCGHAIDNKYCAACGQKRMDEEDYSISHFLSHAFHEFTHFDSKIFKSVKYLLFKPGQMTNDYLSGKRSRYMNPVQLFIIINVIFFFVTHYMGNINIFATPLSVHEQSGEYQNIVNRMVQERLMQTHQTHAAFEEIFNHKMQAMAKSLIIIMVPLFAVCTFILYHRRRKYYVQHLIYSFHFFSFLLISLFTIVPIVLIGYEILASSLHWGIKNEDPFFFYFFMPMLFLYLFLSTIKVFEVNKLKAIVGSMILVIAFGYLFNLYRFILFLSVYYTIPH